MMKKTLVLVLCACFLSSMTVNASSVSSGDVAQDNTSIGDVIAGEPDGTVSTFEIPEVVGKNYEEADALLAGVPLEIIHTFAASDAYAEDVVISQSASGTVTEGEMTQLILTISEGAEDQKVQELSEGGQRGLAAIFSDEADIVIDGDFSDWADKPYSWEFGYDNSNEVWNGWFYVDGKLEQCEKGTFNNNVRHKISLYCDGENVYVYVQLAKAYKAGFSGEDYEFTIDGQMAAFQLFTQNVDMTNPGVYTVDVKDRHTYALADGASAKILVHEGGIYNELELMIPLTAMETHNPAIDIENIGTIQFRASHLMYRPVTTSGADTMPFVWAALALLLIPTSAFVIKKYAEKKKA